MARKKKVDKPFDGGLNVKEFVSSLSSIEDVYNIAPDETLAILKHSFEKAYKLLVNENAKNAEDMRVEANIDIDKGLMSMVEIKDVCEEENLEDDFLQLSVEEARQIDPNINAGEQLRIPVDFTKLGDKFPLKVMPLFLQRMKEESRSSIRKCFSDKIGTNIIGTVENVEENRVTVNFDKANGVMFGRDLIKDESLRIGDRIKCYLRGVDEKRKDAILLISRSDKNFLKNLFYEHVQEVSDGIITIHGISRIAGERAKISVSSSDSNIDPTGSCIGPDGSRINSIRDEVNKERIDIVKYNDNFILYVAEALRPAEVVGVNLNIDPNDENKILVIVKNDGKRVAIGKSGVNVRLASQLIGKTIDIKELDEAMGENIKYTSIDDVKREQALNILDEKEQSENTHEDDYSPEVEEEVEEKFGSLPEEDEEPEVKVETPEKKPTVDEQEHIEIKSTKPRVSLVELEQQIEQEKKQGKPQPQAKSKPSKKDSENSSNQEEALKAPTPISKPKPSMPIYTEEELMEIEEEENEDEDDFEYEDYEEYDEGEY
ncbi:MAG TPA: transcription termination factor NusA [Firmicutes bacterium]|nr:transcription termination factor NusA [Bacillota bacterium]